MWLLVVSPTISRTLPTPMAMPGTEAACEHTADHHHPSMPDDPDSHSDKCGYCVLLGHTPLLAGAAPVLSLATHWPVMPAVQHGAPSRHASPRLSADPRGPPST